MMSPEGDVGVSTPSTSSSRPRMTPTAGTCSRQLQQRNDTASLPLVPTYSEDAWTGPSGDGDLAMDPSGSLPIRLLDRHGQDQMQRRVRVFGRSRRLSQRLTSDDFELTDGGRVNRIVLDANNNNDAAAASSSSSSTLCAPVLDEGGVLVVGGGDGAGPPVTRQRHREMSKKVKKLTSARDLIKTLHMEEIGESDYDLDSEDESFLSKLKRRNGILMSEDRFEDMVERLEGEAPRNFWQVKKMFPLVRRSVLRPLFDHWKKKKIRKWLREVKAATEADDDVASSPSTAEEEAQTSTSGSGL